MDVIDELTKIAESCTDKTGTIDYHVGEAISDSYFDAIKGEPSTAEALFRRHYRSSLNGRLRPPRKNQGEEN